VHVPWRVNRRQECGRIVAIRRRCRHGFSPGFGHLGRDSIWPGISHLLPKVPNPNASRALKWRKNRLPKVPVLGRETPSESHRGLLFWRRACLNPLPFLQAVPCSASVGFRCTDRGKSDQARHVVLCCGHRRRRRLPDVDGQAGVVSHSSGTRTRRNSTVGAIFELR
jgi:hypothetical protein